MTTQTLTETVPELLQKAVREYPQGVFLKILDTNEPEKAVVSWSFQDLQIKVRKTVRGLESLGITKGSRLTLLAENSPEWQVIAIAAQTLGLEVVGLLSALGEADVANILPRVSPEIIVVSSQEQRDKVEKIRDRLPSLKCLILLAEDASDSPRSDVLRYAQLIQQEPLPEAEFAELVARVSSTDPFMMIFTSGTSGHFKGVHLTQASFVDSLEAGAASLNLSRNDCGLLMLPFGHIAGQCIFYIALKTQSSLVFCPNRKAMARAFSLGPTYCLLVPFFWVRVHREAFANIRRYSWPVHRFIRYLIAAAIRVGKRQGNTFDRAMAWMASRIVGRKIRKKLGGRLNVIISGGAPIDTGMISFFRGLGFDFLNYYGMSETSGTIALESVLDRRKKIGNTGKPWKSLEIKISEEGEILVRGKTLFSGYLDEKDTTESLTPEGFFRTGDLGFLDQEGRLSVTGRKKHLIVLNTGEKVSSETVEQEVIAALQVENAVLLGNQEAYVGAALFVAKDVVARMEKELGSMTGIEKHFMKKIHQSLGGLADFSIPERVFIVPGTPADYPEILTPTMKIKRNNFEARFRTEIERMFGRGTI